MKTLDIAIGKKLPLDILMQPVALLAQRGWGKTVTAKGCYEAAHDAGAQCITVFPTGKWWSLRLAADGKSPGLTDVFIIGGPHGDVPLTPGSGRVIAKLLVDKRVHAVIDVSLLRKGERHRFLADLFEEFWLLKKMENESYPVVVFIEEAHAIAPQILRQGQIDEARMLGAVEDLAAEGRNHGIGIVLLDQRSARVNKNIIALVEVLILGRIGYPSDRKIIGEWVVDKGAEDLSWLKELPRLKPGEAYVYAPVLEIFERLPLRMARTFNATATAKIGERTVKAGALSEVDVSALKEQMAGVIAEAEKDDPRALKRELAQLKAEIAKKRGAPAAAAVPGPAPKPVAVHVISGKERAAIDRLSRDLENFYDRLSPLRITAEDLKGRLSELTKKYPSEVGKPPPIPLSRPVARAPAQHPAAQVVTVLKAEGLSAKATEILRELVALPELSNSRDNLAMRAGLRNNGNFRNYMSELRTAGYLDADADAPTAAAAELFKGTARPKTFAELREQWARILTAKAAAMFDATIASGDKALTRDELAAAVELQNNGNFRNYMSELNTAALLDDERRCKGIVANPALYLGGE